MPPTNYRLDNLILVIICFSIINYSELVCTVYLALPIFTVKVTSRSNQLVMSILLIHSLFFVSLYSFMTDKYIHGINVLSVAVK